MLSKCCHRRGFAVVFCLTLLVAGAMGQESARDSAAGKIEAGRQRQARLTLIRIAIDENIAAGDVVANQLTTLKKNTTDFNATLQALLDNDNGKRIAKDHAVCVAFRKKVFDQGPAPTEEFDARITAVQTVVASLRADLSKLSDTYVPSSAFHDTIEKHKNWAAERRTQLAERKAAYDACLAAAPTVNAGESVSTLKEAIAQLAADEFHDLASIYDQVAKETNPVKEALIREAAETAELRKAYEEAIAVRRELEAKLALMQKEHELTLTRLEQERDKLRQEVEQLNVQREVKQAQHARDLDKQRLIAKCDEAGVKETLAPFLADGYWQPYRIDQTDRGRRISEKKPVSLKLLTDAGALNSGDAGIATMLRAACSTFNDRSSWGFKAGGANTASIISRAPPAFIEKARHAQELLKELGPTLVELGRLSE